MRRHQLEHIIRAAAAIAGEREIMVIGAASLLGSVPDPPDSLATSIDADVYPFRRPELADLIDGSIGQLSPFEEEFGYYAHGVGPETAKLPAGWETRVVSVQNENTQQNIGYCLEPHDLAASKLAAGREKDKSFVQGMLEHELVDARTVQERIASLPISPAEKARIEEWLSARVHATSAPAHGPVARKR